jgi:hypothetical protein
VPLLAGHLQPGLELRRVRHRDLQEQHRVVGRDPVAQALLVRLFDVLQEVTGMRLVGDDADLAVGGRLLEEAPGGLVQVDLGGGRAALRYAAFSIGLAASGVGG